MVLFRSFVGAGLLCGNCGAVCESDRNVTNGICAVCIGRSLLSDLCLVFLSALLDGSYGTKTWTAGMDSLW